MAFTKEDLQELKELCKPGGEYDLNTDDGRKAMAVKVLKRVNLEIPAVDLASFLLEVDNSFSVGDTPQWYDLGGLTVWQHEPGGYSPRSHVVKKVFTASPNFYSITSTLSWTDRESGRYGSLAGIVDMMRDRLVGEKSYRLWSLMKTSVPSTHANYSSASATLSKAAVDNAIARMHDAGGNPKAIVGRYLAVSEIADFADTAGIDFSEQARREIEMRGMLGTYRGVPVFSFPKFTDELDVELIDSQNVFVVGDKLGKLAPTSGVQMREWEEENTLDWNTKLFEEYMMVIFDVGKQLQRIEIT